MLFWDFNILDFLNHPTVPWWCAGHIHSISLVKCLYLYYMKHCGSKYDYLMSHQKLGGPPGSVKISIRNPITWVPTFWAMSFLSVPKWSGTHHSLWRWPSLILIVLISTCSLSIQQDFIMNYTFSDNFANLFLVWLPI